ncbi:Uncharacterised protein [Klebsiella pneumoniae]|nr:Uncharacterised protein [Klebsiella pneumoniae]
MITQQIISSELEVLKKHIDSGDIREGANKFLI